MGRALGHGALWPVVPIALWCAPWSALAVHGVTVLVCVGALLGAGSWGSAQPERQASSRAVSRMRTRAWLVLVSQFDG